MSTVRLLKHEQLVYQHLRDLLPQGVANACHMRVGESRREVVRDSWSKEATRGERNRDEAVELIEEMTGILRPK